MNTIQNLFQQAQLAEAAYANLIGAIGNQSELKKALDSATGTGEFSTAQAAAFATHWRVVDQYDNSALFGLIGTGFSATLFERLDANQQPTGQYSFAIRGSQDIADFAADKSLITTDGTAVQQVVDMYNYWTSLTTGTNSYQAAKLNTQVVATAFLTLLYAGSSAGVPDSLSALFGGAASIDSYDLARAALIGSGYIVEGGTVYQLEWGDSQYVLAGSHISVGLNKVPGGALVSVGGHSLGGHLAMAFSRLFPSATAEAAAVNGLGFKINDANINSLFSMLGGAASFTAAQIQNVYGIDGPEFAAMNNHDQRGQHRLLFEQPCHVAHALTR